ncbi:MULTISPECIES: Eco57I restriction-modification methylase domain-containing protein [Erysipelothrix]|uniref:Eco57I restriction-modification methylase domain-containing protein n=1 Tax=Erysipelothrix TaxID=1647 RepID=UPI0014093E67|nr:MULTISPECIES: SNF2-related protein [Erysipelothrix]MDV7678446.1 DEAD/DEAH box helicase family protein [Erysipelothrix rhusiopathiae]WMT70146.1 DEAD/DEAH box helicase family protein [Erysipelothrix rhusiopathiae]
MNLLDDTKFNSEGGDENENRLGSLAGRQESPARERVEIYGKTGSEDPRNEKSLRREVEEEFRIPSPRESVDRTIKSNEGSARDLPSNNSFGNDNRAVFLENTEDFMFKDMESFYMVSQNDKVLANIQAIELANELRESNLQANHVQREMLARYVGWGGLADIFGNSDKFSLYQNRLRTVTTPQEYRSAEDSVLTAYYTDPLIIDTIYKHLINIGFKGGRILDPSMGTGNFFSAMPKNIANNSDRFGVELDQVTGQIAKHLFPNTDIQVKGFEETSFENNSFDLVISNIPFSDYTIRDKRYKKDYLIHEYFIKKSLDLLADKGVVCFITSTGFLDKRNETFRREINEISDFKGAVRLPNNAFQKIAGTRITSDIVFFQKNLNKKPSEQLWLKSEKFNEEEVNVNNFYIQNEFMMLGTPNVQNYRGQTFTLEDNGLDLIDELADALGVINIDIAEPIEFVVATEIHDEVEQSGEHVRIQENVSNYRKYSYALGDEGNLFYLENRDFVPVTELGDITTNRIKGMIRVRAQVNKVIDYQTSQNEFDEEDFSVLLRELNDRYDKFVSKFGFISDKVNERAFREDETYHLLTSLELPYEDSEAYYKADIFRKATISKHVEFPDPQNHYEALYQSLNINSSIDMKFINEKMNTSTSESYQALNELIYIDPISYNGQLEQANWVLSEEYLSGDVVTKLNEAKWHLEMFPELEINYQSLLKIQPRRIEAKDINFRIGTRWIPTDVFSEFMLEVFDIEEWISKRRIIKVDYIEFSDTYNVVSSNYSNAAIKHEYGTTRKDGFDIIKDSLNLKETEVRDRVEYVTANGNDSVRYVLNPKETILARQKQEALESKFKEWVFANPNIAQELVDLYNDQFNRYVNREYDGSHITIDGMSTIGDLKAHQKNMIARIVADGRGLMAHEVGAGKTLTMIGAGFKMRDLGLIQKPLYVVPNHLIGSFASEMMRWFPGRKVLATSNYDFEKKRRLRFVSKIATGEYDAVIIGHSQFERISLSKDRQALMISEEIDTISELISRHQSESGNNQTIKAMIRTRKSLEKKMDDLIKDERKDNLMDFEELGVDFLFVDESHNYKNLENYTKLSNVAGVNSTSSQKATDMYMKTKYLFDTLGHRGVVHATGTPISNSMSEMFTQMKFLIPDYLEKHNLSFFDKWISTFAEINSNLEITPDGSQYQMKTRLSKFHNVPELMKIFNLFADVQTQDMLDLNVPKIINDKAQIIVTEKSYHQEMMMQDLVERSEKIRRKEVSPEEDNMLKITSEARLMAIDPRLMEEELEVEVSKLTACADKVFEIWESTKENKSSQLVFSDVGVPNPKKFNVYNELKNLLVSKGIPEEEIAFIHTANTDIRKEKMFEKVRSGEIRVMLGSTQKLGTGTNVQNNLIAAHHIDCPWRPSDIIQRDGRIVRQGNINENVHIFRYITKGTFDAFLWQIQEQKNFFISQIMTGRSSIRSADDLDDTVLNAAEVKAIATDNPILAEKMTVDNRVNHLRILESSYNSTKVEMNRNITKKIPEELVMYSRRIDNLKSDLEDLSIPASLNINVGGTVFLDPTEAGRELNKMMSLSKSLFHDVGEYAGLKLMIKRGFASFDFKLEGHGEYYLDISKTPTSRDIQKIVDYVKEMPLLLERWESTVVSLQADLERYNEEMGKPFEFKHELDVLLEKQADLNLQIEHGISSKELLPDEDEAISKELSLS